MPKKGNIPWNKGLKNVQTPYWTGKKRGPQSEETKEKKRLSMIGKNVGKSRKHTPEERIAKSKRQRGNKSHLWKGGLTEKNQSIRTSIEYKLWREAVFERDGYTCIWCGAKSKKGKAVYLQADHIKPFAHYPELRFAIDNGRTLCIDCHKTTDSFGWKSRWKLIKEK